MTQEEVRLAYMRSCEAAFEVRLSKLYRTLSDYPEDVEFLVEHWGEVVGYLVHPMVSSYLAHPMVGDDTNMPSQLLYKVPYSLQILGAIDFLCGLVEDIRDEGDTCIAYICLGDDGKTWTCVDEEEAHALLASGREDVQPVLLMSKGSYDKAVPLASATQLKAIVSTHQAKKYTQSNKTFITQKKELQALLHSPQDDGLR